MPFPEIAGELLKLYVSKGVISDLLPTKTELADGLEQLFKDLDFTPNGRASSDGALLSDVIALVKRFQQNAGGMMIPDGIFGKKTLNRLLTRPGCGASATRPANPGPPVQQQPGGGPCVVMVFIESLPRLGANGTFQDSFLQLRKAFFEWTGFLNISVNVTSDIANANLVIRCRNLDSEPPPTLAITHIGPPNGRQLEMIFDARESWTHTKFYSTALHEFGHFLGISHEDVNNSQSQVMHDTLDEQKLFPQQEEINVAKSRWQNCGNSKNPGILSAN